MPQVRGWDRGPHGGAIAIRRRKLVFGIGLALATAGSTLAPVAQAMPAMAAGRAPYSWITPGQEQPFYGAMLDAIGATVAAANLQVMEAWARSEGSRSAYNPWNTTQRAAGSHTDSNGSTSFVSAESAIGAMKRQMESLYRNVIAGFRAANAEQTIAAIVASPWAGSHYGGAADYRKSLIWKVYVGLPATGWRPSTLPRAAPGAVPIIAARSTKRRVVLIWGAAHPNGSRIRQYEASIRTRDPATRAWVSWQSHKVHRSARSTTWPSLEVGRRYQIVIRARNAEGFGPWSGRINVVV